jgi:GMC oxidoreductase
MLSGVGPADELRRHGIQLVHHSPGVGSNLQDHLRVDMHYRCTKPVSINRNQVSIIRCVFAALLKRIFYEKLFDSSRIIHFSVVCEVGRFLEKRRLSLHASIIQSTHVVTY